VAHSNRKQFAIRLSIDEREALVAIVQHALDRVLRSGRDSPLLRRILKKLSDPGV
jgi:ABC-type amino acid transport substrate-binding protein